MKKFLSLILLVLLCTVLFGCVCVSAYTVDFDFEDNLISLSVRDTRYKVTLDKFVPYGVVSVERRGLYSFRLVLDKHDHQNVLDVISQIRSAEDGYMCTVSPVYYETPTEPTEGKDYLYKDKFIEYEVDIDDMGSLDFYDELYYHIDDDGNMEWALLYADTSPFDEVGGEFRFADRIIVVNEQSFPFTYKYGVYDVKEDKFVAIDEYIDYTKYDGLQEYVYINLGVLIGDADNDNELTIIDATMIQRNVAQICSYKEKYWMDDYCDLDKDHDITVMDATIIQRKLAQID